MRWYTLVGFSMLAFSPGCSIQSSQSGLSDAETGTVFGGPSTSELLTPYQGHWQFASRRFDPEPERIPFTGGPDISVTGHIIRFGSGILVSELRLCQVRSSDGGIDAEAWHHEDIHDPGDMQRADCRLSLVGDNLELHWRMVASDRFTDDPVIAPEDYVAPDRSGSAADLTWFIETYTPNAE